jgi:2-oxoglutarate ferredoxin oxidoreductase subunit beta
VLSPCVTFNNNAGSTKSYDFVRAHMESTATMDFVPERRTITASYEEGTTRDIRLHDGSSVQLHKLAPGWDPTDKMSAMNRLYTAKAQGEILTGLLYIETESPVIHDLLATVEQPLNALSEAELCPGSGALEEINSSLR